MPRPILLVLCALVCAGAAPATATADPGDLLVRFKERADSKDRHAALSAAGVQHQESLPVSGLERVDPLPGVSVEDAAAHLRRDEDVVYAEADATRTSTAEVDDTRFDFQWGFQQISAPEAWDVTVGSDQVKVAVLDTGADLDHPDLVANLVSGWDFVDQDPFPYDDSDDGHGTHVAGVIGAGADNGLGVAGLNWHVQLMPLRTLGADGRGTVSSEVEAIAYGAQRGVKVVNMSFAGDDFSHAEYDAIKAARDTLFVVASGNGYGDNDRVPAYPCNYELDNVVCVTASGTLDTRPVGQRGRAVRRPRRSGRRDLQHPAGWALGVHVRHVDGGAARRRRGRAARRRGAAGLAGGHGLRPDAQRGPRARVRSQHGQRRPVERRRGAGRGRADRAAA